MALCALWRSFPGPLNKQTGRMELAVDVTRGKYSLHKKKGMELETQDFDLMGGENRAKPYLGKNPGGQMPALELDDG